MDEPVPVLEPVVPRRPGRAAWVAVGVALAIVVALVAWLLLTRAAQPGVGDARLAIVELDGGLVTTDAGGEPIRSLDVPNVRFQFPAWSPDGTRVAAIGTDGSTSGVYVFDAAATARTPATPIYTSTDRPAFYLYWTPDSRQVTFLTTEPTGIALRVAPADGGSPSTVVREAAPFYWDFVDASRLLVHTGDDGSDAFVGEVGLDGSPLESPDIRSGAFRAPAVADGGAARAYVQPAPDGGGGGGQELVLEARDGATRHEIAVGANVAFGFDPGSSTLAYIASGEQPEVTAAIPVGPLKVVDATSGEVRTLVDRGIFAFFWSPDGSTLAFLDFPDGDGTEPGEARLERGAGAARLASTTGAVPPLATEPGGVRFRLGFVDVASGAIRGERDIRASELFAFQVLPFFDQYALSHRFWAPDGSAFVLPISAGDGRTDVVAFPADGSDPRTVSPGAIGFWSP